MSLHTSPRTASSLVSLQRFTCLIPILETHKPTAHHLYTRTARPSPHACRCSAEDRAEADGEQLATEFSRVLNETGLTAPQPRGPTHLLPPTTAIAAQMDALQRNNWPEGDAGVRVAFNFSKPEGAEDATAGTRSNHARTWAAAEEWIDFPTFSNMLHQRPYNVMLECDAWAPVSALMFPSARHEKKAVQAVQVMSRGRAYTFSFCVEKMGKGPYEGCWLTTGVRQGNYTV